MSDPLLLLAATTLLAACVIGLRTIAGLRSLPRLEDAPAPAAEGYPRVSIVVAARDEERHVAAAVEALLRQDYPEYEVVVVDDRSTDATPDILRGLVAEHGRAAGGPLRVVRIERLPAGWLGKTHALQVGAGAAAGSLLLFADADVVLAPDALARAVSLLRREGLDHLAVAPRMRVGGPWAAMAVAVFLVVFSMVFRPWKAREPRSRAHIGIGAFNLVRASAYRAVGGHRRIALRPDDDVRLGRLLKEAGHRQAAALGRELVQVEWYPSLAAMARGLRKNTFAAVDYRLSLVALGTLVPVLLVFWPVAAVVLTAGATRWLNLAILAVGAATTWDAARQHRLPWWAGAAHVIGSALILWIIWAAALAAVRTGRIEWRGTMYPLAELRAGRPATEPPAPPAADPASRPTGSSRASSPGPSPGSSGPGAPTGRAPPGSAG